MVSVGIGHWQASVFICHNGNLSDEQHQLNENTCPDKNELGRKNRMKESPHSVRNMYLKTQ